MASFKLIYKSYQGDPAYSRRVCSLKILKYQDEQKIHRKSDKFIVPMKQVMTVEGRDLLDN